MKMKDGMKLNPEIVKLIGETKTQLLADKMDELNKKFLDCLLEQYANIVEEARASFSKMLENPELDEHRSYLLESARSSVLDQLGCSMVAMGAETAVELGTGYADFAAHALGHLENAYRDKTQRKVLGSLTGVLMGLIPPEIQERLKKAEEDRKTPR